MIDVKNRFREGFILLLRPFLFKEISIRKFTICYAFSEKPLYSKEINPNYETKLELLLNQKTYFNKKSIEDEIEQLDKNKYIEYYEGEIVISEIDNVQVRFFPNEYSIIQNLTDFVIDYDDYNAVLNEKLLTKIDFLDKVFYLKSRGLSEDSAKRIASFTFKDLVYYLPSLEINRMFK